jgi:hypothetical protein
MEKMEEDTGCTVLAEMRQAHEIAAVAGRDAQTMRSDLVRWKIEGQIFSIEYEGTEYFPCFALDPGVGYTPYPALAEVLRVLNAGNWGSAWAVVAWFIGLNSFLDDQRPQDLLASEPEWVVEAAKDIVYSLNQQNW